MTPAERIRLELACLRVLDAVESGDREHLADVLAEVRATDDAETWAEVVSLAEGIAGARAPAVADGGEG